MEQKFGYRRAVLYIISIIMPLLIHTVAIILFLTAIKIGNEYNVVERVIIILVVTCIFALDLRWIIMFYKICFDILAKQHDQRIIQIRDISQDKKYAIVESLFTRNSGIAYTKNYIIRIKDRETYPEYNKFYLRMKGRISPIMRQIDKVYKYKYHQITYLKHSKFIIDIKPIKDVEDDGYKWN